MKQLIKYRLEINEQICLTILKPCLSVLIILTAVIMDGCSFPRMLICLWLVTQSPLQTHVTFTLTEAYSCITLKQRFPYDH